MNIYYLHIFREIKTVYLATNDIIISTVLNTKDTKINLHNTMLPTNIKRIDYKEYIRLLTYYKCIK